MYLVTGATGNVGAELVRLLAGEGVRALTRRPAATPAEDGVTEVVGDLDEPESLGEALAGVRGLFLLPGYRDMPGVLAKARTAGVERVVLLSGGSASGTERTDAISTYLRRSERAVHESGLAWTILRPAGFMSNTLRWLPQLRVGDLVRAPFADVRVAVIDPLDIATVAALALRGDQHSGDQHSEQTYPLSGPAALTPADQVATLAEVLDRPLRFAAQPNDEARAELAAAMPVEYVDAFFSFYVDGTLDESPVLPTVPELTGRPARTFPDWARAHAAEFA